MIVSIKNVNKSYKNQVILDDITYKIEKPKIIGLVAPNGSGKTTLFNVICNLENVKSGEIYIFDQLNNSNAIFKELSYMQDNKILYADLTGMDHLLYVAGCHKIIKKDILELISDLNMNRYVKKKVRTYSLGMKQTLLLAMAIVSKPKLLLLDEPLNGLDVTICAIFRKKILQLHESGTTVIISSHNLEEIEKLTNDVVFLTSGKLVSNHDRDLLSQLGTQSMKYEIVLDLSNAIINELKREFQFSILSKYKIEIRLTKKEKEDLVLLCKLNSCIIYDIQLKENTTYQIYKMLFEGQENI